MILPVGASMFRYPSFRRKAKEPKAGSDESRLPTMPNTQQAGPHSIDTGVPIADTTTLTNGFTSNNSNTNSKPSPALLTIQPPREDPQRRDIQAGYLQTAIPIEDVASPGRFSSWSRRTPRTTLYPDVTGSLLLLEQGHHASFEPPLCTAHLVTAMPVYAGNARPLRDACSSAVLVPDGQQEHATRTAPYRSPSRNTTTIVATVAINEGIYNNDEKSSMTTFDQFFQHPRWTDTATQQLWDEEKEIQDIVITSANQVWDDYVRKRQKDTREHLSFLTPEMIEQQRQADRKVQQTIFDVANEAWEKTLLQTYSQQPQQNSNHTREREMKKLPQFS